MMDLLTAMKVDGLRRVNCFLNGYAPAWLRKKTNEPIQKSLDNIHAKIPEMRIQFNAKNLTDGHL